MKIEVEDSSHFKRLAKADDMAFCLFELQNNLWRKWKHTASPTGQEVLDAMYEIIEEHNINVDDLNE